MSSFSQFSRLKSANDVDRRNLSTVYGYTQYGVSQFIGDTTTSGESSHDEVANDIPRIQKMYGVNTLYANLVGDRNTTSSRVKTARYGNNMWLDIFEALTTYYVGTGHLDRVVTVSDLETDDLNYAGEGIGTNKLFWVGANKRNLYSIPKVGSHIALSGVVPPDYRKFWDTVSSSSVDQTSVDEGSYELLSPCYVTYDERTKSWEVLSSYPMEQLNFMAQTLVDTVLVIVFLVKHFNAPNKFAFYVKPVGVNRVYVDYFSRNKYQLEAVGLNRDSQFIVKPITVTESMQDLHGGRTELTKVQWVIYDFDTKADNAGDVVPKFVKFRLRRPSDNKIGNLSTGTIKMILRTSGAFMRWLVV